MHQSLLAAGVINPRIRGVSPFVSWQVYGRAIRGTR